MAAVRFLPRRELIGQARASLRRARLSALEISFLVIVVIFSGAVLYLYLAVLGPRRSALNELDARARNARAQIERLTADQKKLSAQQANAGRIIDSLGDFERRLKDRQQGTPQIIDEINGLARAHQMLAGDYSYRMSEAPVSAEAGGPASLRDERNLNLYPALGISTTVVGDYQRLRQMIAAIERSRQFIVINALIFQGEADRLLQAGGAPKSPSPGVALGASPVSLKIEMDTFFRPAGH